MGSTLGKDANAAIARKFAMNSTTSLRIAKNVQRVVVFVTISTNGVKIVKNVLDAFKSAKISMTGVVANVEKPETGNTIGMIVNVRNVDLKKNVWNGCNCSICGKTRDSQHQLFYLWIGSRCKTPIW